MQSLPFLCCGAAEQLKGAELVVCAVSDLSLSPQAYQRLQIQQQMLQAQRNVSGPMRQQEQQVGVPASSICALEFGFSSLERLRDIYQSS